MGGIKDNKCKNPAVLGCGSVSRLEVDPSYLTPHPRQGVWHCGAMLRSDFSKLPFKLGSVISDKKPTTIFPATMVQVTTGDGILSTLLGKMKYTCNLIQEDVKLRTQ